MIFEGLKNIRNNTGAWKDANINEKFNYLNNGACIQISRNMYNEIKGKHPNHSKKDVLRLYLSINKNPEGSGDYIPIKNNLVVYLINSKYDKSITGDINKEKIFSPEIIGNWTSSPFLEEKNFNEKKKINRKSLQTEKFSFYKENDSIGEDKRQEIVERYFKWIAYGSIWTTDASKEAVQVFEFSMTNLEIIFGKTDTTDAIIFFSMNDYEDEGISYPNELEISFCAKRTPPSTKEGVKHFLEFYQFENVSTPYPPFNMDGKGFNLLPITS